MSGVLEQAIVLGDSFEVVLQQQKASPDRDNILLHGCGEQQQRDGMAPVLALQAFDDFIQSAPPLAFYSAFDATMLNQPLLATPGLPIAQ